MAEDQAYLDALRSGNLANDFTVETAAASVSQEKLQQLQFLEQMASPVSGRAQRPAQSQPSAAREPPVSSRAFAGTATEASVSPSLTSSDRCGGGGQMMMKRARPACAPECAPSTHGQGWAPVDDTPASASSSFVGEQPRLHGPSLSSASNIFDAALPLDQKYEELESAYENLPMPESLTEGDPAIAGVWTHTYSGGASHNAILHLYFDGTFIQDNRAHSGSSHPYRGRWFVDGYLIVFEFLQLHPSYHGEPISLRAELNRTKDCFRGASHSLIYVGAKRKQSEE